MQPNRVLIVDDEVSFVNLVKLNLEKTGRYTVQVVTDPKLAVAAAREFKPAAVLLDLIMPSKDGGQVLAELRSDSSLKDIPVILVTATVPQHLAKTLQGKARVHSILAKPVDPKKLIQHLDRLLDAPFFTFHLGRSSQPAASET